LDYLKTYGVLFSADCNNVSVFSCKVGGGASQTDRHHQCLLQVSPHFTGILYLDFTRIDCLIFISHYNMLH